METNGGAGHAGKDTAAVAGEDEEQQNTAQLNFQENVIMCRQTGEANATTEMYIALEQLHCNNTCQSAPTFPDVIFSIFTFTFYFSQYMCM